MAASRQVPNQERPLITDNHRSLITFMKPIARITSIHRYPVKSMAGEELDSATLGWHGLDGDRRLAFVRQGVRVGFPFLTASKLPALITYRPLRPDGANPDVLPSLVRTPDGRELDLRGDELCAELSVAHGAPVELMQLDNGVFDDASVSLIASVTIAAVGDAAGSPLDPRRFRPNLLIETLDGVPYGEDRWVGRTIRFGDAEDGPAIVVCVRDVRCVMLNLDPDTAVSDPRVLKAAVRLNENYAGLYASVIRTGRVARGDWLYLL
jgi:uncharacterized protein YcbX